MLGLVRLLRSIPDAELETGDLVVVDDEAAIVARLCSFLTARGYRVRTAGSMADAREQLARRRPDLLLCDLFLRDGDACEVLPELRREGLLPATLLLTGHALEELGPRLGALTEVIGVVSKPIALEALARRIGEFLAGDRRARATVGLPLP